MTGAGTEGDAQPGLWSSPISARAAAAGRLRIGDVQLDGADLCWIEGRPSVGGRSVIVRERVGVAADLIEPPFSARTRVHEYGGGAMRARGGAVYFSNGADARVYKVEHSGPEALTPAIGDVRYADFEVDASRERLLCVVEDHRGPAVVNDIRAIPLAGGDPVSIITGNDFYSTPRISPDGARIAWLTWNHPNMPWDGCELWVAALDGAGLPQDARVVAGGAAESIFQPSWSPQSVLHFTSDRTGWWNLYRDDGGAGLPLAPMEAECGGAQWVFALSAYAFCADGRIVLWACRDGSWEFHELDPSGELRRVQVPYTQFGLQVSAHHDDVVFLAGAPEVAQAVVRYDLHTGEHDVVRSVSDDVALHASILSIPRHVTFPGDGGALAHAWYYAPRN
ncbi:MAG: hypothetical protein QOE18_1288, partial [Chloroflexota bacterium]|nr:hypothetical protein [Chloroflexota bacterium]